MGTFIIIVWFVYMAINFVMSLDFKGFVSGTIAITAACLFWYIGLHFIVKYW